MALRERQWAIMIRPYFIRDNKFRINYDGVPKAGLISDLGYTTGQDTARALRGVGEGGGDMPTDKGGWVEWCRTSSFVVLREKFKEISKDIGKDDMKIVEVLDLDTIVTPLT